MPSGKIFSDGEWLELIRELALPPRQVDIVKQIFCGHGDKQIARNLGITVPTVRTHLSRIFAKQNVSDRTELVLCLVGHFRARCPRDTCPRGQ